MHEETKIEMKLEEETKPIKKICEKVMDIVSTEFEKGAENVDTKEMGEAIDILKDLYEAKEKIVKACYYKYILAAMEKEETEEEETKKIMEKMREEYGSEDEDMERRFYDNYRYKRTGRFAPKGRGSYVGRRGYEEPPYYRMSPEMYKEHDPEWYRDMDRADGRMYYSGGGSNSSGSSGNMGGSRSGGGMGGNSGNMGGGSSSRGYEEGYSDGNRRGYEDGMRDGERMGRNSQSRDSREGRSGRSRRSYMETKEMNKDNSAESKQKKMKELEAYMAELSGDITEMINDASPEERSLLKQKLQVLTQKVN